MPYLSSEKYYGKKMGLTRYLILSRKIYYGFILLRLLNLVGYLDAVSKLATLWVEVIHAE